MTSTPPTDAIAHIRELMPDEDALIARHFYQLWRDNDVAEELIRADWLEITCQFVDRARRELGLKAFVAEVDGVAIGSTSCQLFEGLYPNVLTTEHRNYGYIWNVYVEPTYRGRGIATQLTETAIAYLKSLGCTRAILHASPLGKPVYSKVGFVDSNEMRLDLI